MDTPPLFLGIASCIAVSAEQCKSYTLNGYDTIIYKNCSSCCSYTTPSLLPCCDSTYGPYTYVSNTNSDVLSTMSAASIAGIVIGSLVGVSVLVTIIVCCVCFLRKTSSSGGQIISRGVPMQPIVTTGSPPNMSSMSVPGMIQQQPNGYNNTGFVAGATTPPPADINK